MAWPSVKFSEKSKFSHLVLGNSGLQETVDIADLTELFDMRLSCTCGLTRTPPQTPFMVTVPL